MKEEILLLSQAVSPLLEWYRGHARELPWRTEATPYHVWVSEIMLQQTRVNAVIPYFKRWMAALPSIRDLAEAPEELLLKLWEGLGYYNRVRNLQKAAIQMMDEYQGEMPSEYEALLQLPGIGEYTAGAISSIAFGKPEVAVDGNVLRVIVRLLGSYRDIKAGQTKKDIQQLLRSVLPETEAGTFNQALMELGATVCLPNGMPLCERCPWESFCCAHAAGSEQMIPVKTPKKSRKIEQQTVFLMRCHNQIAIRKRSANGLLAGLWELPMCLGWLEENQVKAQMKEWGMQPITVQKTKNAKHIFTHIEWHMKGYVVEVAEPTADFLWCSWEEMQENYALPSAFKTYMAVLELFMSNRENF